MREWAKKHWRALAGAAVLAEPIVRGVVWLFKIVLGWLGYLDLLITRIQDPGWIAVVFGVVADPPGWLILLSLVIGMSLITWDYMRNRRIALAGGGHHALAEAENASGTVSAGRPTAGKPPRIPLYTARMWASFEKLDKDRTIAVHVQFYNPNMNALDSPNISGNLTISFSSLPAEKFKNKTVTLYSPFLSTEDRNRVLVPHREHGLTLIQHVPGELAAPLRDAIRSGDPIAFDFRPLIIEYQCPLSLGKVRIKLWDGMSCAKIYEGITATPLMYLSAGGSHN